MDKLEIKIFEMEEKNPRECYKLTTFFEHRFLDEVKANIDGSNVCIRYSLSEWSSKVKLGQPITFRGKEYEIKDIPCIKLEIIVKNLEDGRFLRERVSKIQNRSPDNLGYSYLEKIYDPIDTRSGQPLV